MTQPVVLLVASDRDDRRSISAWLDDYGFTEVMLCPGPGEPDYTCIGGRGIACPLSKAADVVIVAMPLRPDEVLQGTPAWHLVLGYVKDGKQVIVITHADDPVRFRYDEQLQVMTRPIERDALIGAVRARGMLTPAGGW